MIRGSRNGKADWFLWDMKFHWHVTLAGGLPSACQKLAYNCAAVWQSHPPPLLPSFLHRGQTYIATSSRTLSFSPPLVSPPKISYTSNPILVCASWRTWTNKVGLGGKKAWNSACLSSQVMSVFSSTAILGVVRFYWGNKTSHELIIYLCAKMTTLDFIVYHFCQVDKSCWCFEGKIRSFWGFCPP